MDNEPSEPTEIEPALGTIVETGRGRLPFALVHGESLVACAAWALGDAGVSVVDLGHTWSTIAGAGEAYVLHDPLCPLTPAWFIAECVARAQAEDAVVVGVRPVTDTVKRVADGFVGETVDRDGLIAVASPIVLPASVVGAMSAPPTDDFVELVDALRGSHRVVEVLAPPQARRVASEEDLRVLEALTAR